jgi:ribonuclease HI
MSLFGDFMKYDPSYILIFTDGACTGNPGPGGWGSVVVLPNGTVHELGDGNPQTTNNRMEMVAALRALAILEEPQGDIILYTDSQYLINGITKWVFGWRSRGWKSAEGKDVANRDLWEELVRQVARVKPATIKWKYVRGHSGYPGNERCDQIAVSFATKKPDRLYVGPLDGYFVDLSELPPEDEMTSSSKNGSAKGSVKKGSSAAKSGKKTYLSLVRGVVTRHMTWPECDRVVKGVPAKYKKCESGKDERETLRSWGVNPESIKIEGAPSPFND